jgi:hypothetical protein
MQEVQVEGRLYELLIWVDLQKRPELAPVAQNGSLITPGRRASLLESSCIGVTLVNSVITALAAEHDAALHILGKHRQRGSRMWLAGLVKET